MSKASLYIIPLRAIAAVLLALAAIVAAPRAFAQANSNPPERMTYQGFLVDANGNALAPSSPKNYDVIFRIWNDSNASAAANRLWTEQQTVTVDKGYFSVLLGEGSAIGEARPELSTLFTNATASDRWVGLTVKGIGAGGTDVNILPRLRLLTSPYAFLARGVSGAGVINANNLSPTIGLWTATGGDVYRSSGNVGIGTSTPGFPLTFANTLGDKISLWSLSGNNFGFGIQNLLLQIHTDTAASDVVFGYGTSAAMTETMRIKGTGRLQVTGGVIARGGAPGSGGGNNNGYAFTGNGGDTDSGMFSSADGLVQFYTDSNERMRIHPNGNVGIGTTNAPTTKLQVAGDVKLGSSGEYFATGGAENLRIVRGVVNGNGTIISGAGFTVTRYGPGDYMITFTPAFPNRPAVTFTVENGSPNAGTGDQSVQDVATTNFGTSTKADKIFHFIAIGPR